MLEDFRDHIAVTLMGWAAKLATKQYQRELANYIQVGIAEVSAPSYCDRGLSGEFVSIN